MRHYTRFLAALAAAANALLSGCATVIESRLAGTAPAQEGMVYALPKGQVQLVAQRKTVDAEEIALAKKDALDAAAGLAAQEARQVQAKRDLKEATEIHAKVSAETSPQAFEETLRQKVIAQALLKVLDGRVVKANTAVEDALQRAKAVVGKQGECVESVALSLLAHAPDTQARFVAAHLGNPLRDDSLNITVSDLGLLTSSTVVTVDQTAAVILDLVRAGSTAKVASLKLLIAKPMTTPSACAVYRTTRVFDPTRATDIAGVQAHLKSLGATVYLRVDGPATEAIEFTSPSGPWQGYAYRAVRPVAVVVSSKEKVGPDAEETTLHANVPDSSSFFVAPVTGAAFTKTTSKHGFKDGMLVDFNIDKPSQLAAIASLPINILKALIEVPASILKLRVDYESQSNALVTSQSSLLKAQLDVLNAQKALDDRAAAVAGGP